MPFDIFARIGDIKGESLDSKHKDEIEVLSYSWGVAAAPSGGGGGGAGKPTFQDLAITHKFDKASPKLLLACATGEHIKEATITHRKAGGTQHEYLIVKMTDVTITGVNHAGTTEQPMTENISLTFGKIELEYKPQKPDGSLDAGVFFKYDLKNKTG